MIYKSNVPFFQRADLPIVEFHICGVLESSLTFVGIGFVCADCCSMFAKCVFFIFSGMAQRMLQMSGMWDDAQYEDVQRIWKIAVLRSVRMLFYIEKNMWNWLRICVYIDIKNRSVIKHMLKLNRNGLRESL